MFLRSISFLLLLALLAGCRTNAALRQVRTSQAIDTKQQLAELVAKDYEVPPADVALMTPRIYEVIAVHGREARFGCGAVLFHNGALHLITVAHAVMTDPTQEQATQARLSNFVPINETKPLASLWARDYKKNVFPLKLVRWKRQFDLALLTVGQSERVLPETIVPTYGHVDAGESVFICGYRDEFGRRLVQATIDRQMAGINVSLGELVLNTYRTNQLIVPGFSGGPVFAKDTSTLVGVNIARKGNLSFFAHPSSIASLLSEK